MTSFGYVIHYLFILYKNIISYPFTLLHLLPTKERPPLPFASINLVESLKVSRRVNPSSASCINNELLNPDFHLYRTYVICTLKLAYSLTDISSS